MAKVKEGSGRWAIVLKDTNIVSNINVGEEPERPNDQKDLTDVVQVDDEVKIGMIRTGSSFAWPSGHKNESENKSLSSGSGAIRLDDSNKSRGDEVPAKPKEEGPTPQPESMKPTPPSDEPASDETPTPVTPQAQAAAERAPKHASPKAASAKAQRGRRKA